jgi:hypothetical protein
MEMGKFSNKVHDPQVAQLLDNILDTVLALKARLADSNMDSNPIGGINESAERDRINGPSFYPPGRR